MAATRRADDSQTLSFFTTVVFCPKAPIRMSPPDCLLTASSTTCCYGLAPLFSLATVLNTIPSTLFVVSALLFIHTDHDRIPLVLGYATYICGLSKLDHIRTGRSTKLGKSRPMPSAFAVDQLIPNTSTLKRWAAFWKNRLHLSKMKILKITIIDPIPLNFIHADSAPYEIPSLSK